MPSGEVRWDVFLAHASPDKPRARILYQALTDLGLKVFLDEESLLPGDDWPTEIPKALRTSDVVVVLLSAERGYYDGEEVVISIAEVRGGRQRVVPIHLAPDLDNPYGLARKNRIDWHDEAGVDAVVTRLRRVIPRAMRGETTGATIFCHRIPLPPRYFAGRDDLLDRLATSLGEGRTTTLTQAIQGMGGVGKTTVAAALCEAQRDHHDIVWWVRAEDQGTLVADLAELAEAVDVTTGQGGDADAAAVLRWLESTERRWLVVYDNVPDRDSVLPWLPRRGSGAVIVTSRYRHLDDLGPVEHIDTLPDATAERFLRRRAPRAGDQDLEPVLDRVRGLPLALEQAAAWVDRKPNRTFGQWVALYDEAADQAFPDGTKPIGYEHTAATAWRVSIAAATADAPLAERLLGALGHFAPEGVAIQWLRDAAADPYLGATTAQIDATIDALDDYDLVTISVDDTIDVHRIVHDVALRTATADAIDFAARTIVGQAPGGYDPRSWPLIKVLAPHARRIAHGLRPTDTMWTSGLVLLLAQAAKVASEDGQVREALESSALALQQAEAWDVEVQIRIVARDSVATAHQRAGDLPRAIALFEEALDESERFLVKDHPDIFSAKNNLALAYKLSGDATRAIPLLESVVADSERLLGPEHAITAFAYDNLGGACLASGDTTRAIELLEVAVRYREHSLGPAHEDTITSRNNLAVALLTAGDESRATRLLIDALADCERTLGAGHPGSMRIRVNLATFLFKGGETDRAPDLVEQSLGTAERTLGRDHPETERIRTLLTLMRQAIGED